jgi:hypothetical protein
MITANIAAYLRLEQLPELKHVTRGGITTERKIPRYDLTEMAGYWPPLDCLKNHTGRVFFNLIPSDKVDARKQGGTTPAYYLQCTPAKSKAINFSGVRFEYTDTAPHIHASGEPPQTERLKQGVINPMFGRRADGFLFLFSTDLQTLEILILTDGRLLIDAYRRQLANGGIDDAIEALRLQANPVYH